jgi:hypothetical protein
MVGGESLNMQRTRASANPALCNLTLNESMAFAIMHVSKRRKASRSRSVNEGVIVTLFPF